MKTQNIVISAIVALVVGLVVALSVGHAPVEQTPVGNLGATSGQINTNIDTYYNGVTIGNTTNISINGVIGTGKNQASWLNKTGRTVQVNLVRIMGLAGSSATGIASSTLVLSVGTSTAATVTDAANPIYGSLIDQQLISTSTPTIQFVYNNLENQGTNGLQVIPVLPGKYLNIVLENPYNQACTGSACETATSTNRGYNLSWGFDGKYIQ